MSRILKRPMFRKGGSTSKGIMTGLVDRKQYNSGSIDKEEVAKNVGVLEEVLRDYTPKTRLPIGEFGLNLASGRFAGDGALSNIVGSLQDPYSSFVKQSDALKNLDNGVFALSVSSLISFQNAMAQPKYLSPWIAIQLSKEHGNDALRERLSIKATGDITKGAKIAYKNCAICHRYKDVKTSPKNMAPDLSFAGGLYDIAYLKESLMHPSAVIVRSYLDNNQTNSAWSGTNEVGEGTSTMPSFEWLSQQEMNDLLAFLQTLK